MVVIAGSRHQSVSAPVPPGLDPDRVPQVLRVVLVRHAGAAPPGAGVAADQPLTADGMAQADRLRWLNLFDLATGFYAGPEARMVGTLAPGATSRGREVVPMAALAETAAGGWLPDDRFAEVIGRYFAHPDIVPAPGWEAGSVAAHRFGAQLEALRASHPPHVNRDRAVPGVVVVSTGGRVAIAWLAFCLGWSGADAKRAWRRLRNPDIAVIDLPKGEAARLVIPFGTLET
ncbi:MAG: histidine phosphatase family protein [Chloroflexi bacterium]|nr:histidine phosphatase family protein [Chloroflexota bacterium]